MKLSERASLAAGIDPAAKPEQLQLSKRPFRNQYHFGPMGFVAGQIIKRMADKGWPAVRHGDFIRSAAEQKRLRATGRSKAGPWESPHQYGLGVDIIHATRGWDVSDRFWEDLAAIVKVVAREYGVELEHGHYWKFKDSAHVELKNFRHYRTLWFGREPSQKDLNLAFMRELPKVWKAYHESIKGS